MAAVFYFSGCPVYLSSLILNSVVPVMILGNSARGKSRLLVAATPRKPVMGLGALNATKLLFSRCLGMRFRDTDD